MGYCIEYQVEKKDLSRKHYPLRLLAMTVICTIFFVLLVENLWPEGAAVIARWIPAAKDSVAVSAINSFVNDLEVGENFLAAFSAFCRELIP